MKMPSAWRAQKDKFLILGDENVIDQLSDEELEAKVLDKEHRLENIEGALGYSRSC